MKYTRTKRNESIINEHDQTKDMLRFMTEGVKQETDETVLTEYDQTKSMLKTLNEDLGQQDTMGAVSTPDANSQKEDAITLSGAELKSEEDAFGEHVTQDVIFDVNEDGSSTFKIYPHDNNVVWTGQMGKGIKWRLSKNDDVVIKADNLELEDRDMEMVYNLKKYANNWSDEWAKKLRTDYKPRRDGY